MNYCMYLASVMATIVRAEPRSPAALGEVLEPVLRRLRELIDGFLAGPIDPRSAFDFERQLQLILRELGRVVVEWAFNRVEPNRADALPSHVEYGGGLYTLVKAKTPREVSTTFGKIRLERFGYRDTYKTGAPTVFPAALDLGIADGTTPALAECAARYQAEAGATQRRTLMRLKAEHGLDWGVKKLRQVVGRVSGAMSEVRHEVQVEKLLELLGKAYAGGGKNRPVLSVGRDGITMGVPVKSGTVYEVASAGTVSVYDRRGHRLGTVYLARTPESKQGTMGRELTGLVEEVLRRWEKPLPRLCYVTDAGDNESTYYDAFLRRMGHPRTGERLEWIRVVDFYHAGERLWTMAESLFGAGPAAKAWARRMRELLKGPNGVRRVLNSAAALRGRQKPKGNAAKDFNRAYNYLRERTEFMHYAAYKRLGVPRGSGVTEAACKTVYTQRLKLSGMRWKKAGAQTILNLRVLLLSNVWTEAYGRVLQGLKTAKVPTYATSQSDNYEMAA